MKNQTTQLSSITEFIMQVLNNHPTPESLRNKHFLKQLDVLILNKKPITHSFVCDKNTSIQVEFKTDNFKPIESYDLNPWNKVMTHYYQVSHQHDKHFYTLNCNDKTLYEMYEIKNTQQNEPRTGGMFSQESSSVLQFLDKEYQPHPYEPLYYFSRNIFDFFVKNRQSMILQQPLQKIRIYDWVLKVVNISKSNWYSFVIEIHKFKFINEKVWVDEIPQKGTSNKPNLLYLKNIGSIIYDQRFKPILEKMRLIHIKSQGDKQIETGEDEEISMCYHLRNIQVSHKLPKLSQFVTLDTKGEVLKFNKNHQTHFIPIGELEGMCSFPHPINLNKPQKKQQFREINAFSMKGLYEILNKQATESNLIKQRVGRKRGERKRIGEKDWSKMIEERLQNSHYRIRQEKKGNQYSQYLSEGEDSDLWSDSDIPENVPDDKQQGQMGQRDNYLTKYSEILQNQAMNNSSSSSEEQENEYFRKYREEMKKMFGK